MKLSTQILLAFCIVILLSVMDSYTNIIGSLKVEQNTQFLSQSEAVLSHLVDVVADDILKNLILNYHYQY